ncbi:MULTISPECIES: hypothetical protein [Paenibacillus]|uniref:Uncharacterized protein n=2 Tax=Bacteria TaxID=2 RepID=A0ABW9T1F7_9BACL|nr:MULTISPECIES: hypothetical protein [Paenibacillus]MUG67125.1 hypothetical protein [Paenibacillus campinasensis]
MTMRFDFHPRARLLLVNHTNEKVQMLYNANPYTWSMPLIGARPPFYANPRYEPNYPLI